MGRQIWVSFGLGVAAVAWGPSLTFAQDGAPAKPEIEAKALKNPVSHTRASVARGKNIYLRLCQQCHGADGRAQESVDFVATDLTQPRAWRHGDSDGEVFVALRDGTGPNMPGFKDKVGEEDLWHLVNFVHSLRPGARPFVEPAEAEPAAGPQWTEEKAAPEDPKKLKNPVPYGRASILQGKNIYLRTCQQCHGSDGRALESVDYEAADLTAPQHWRHGTTDGEIFTSTRNGAGIDMPPFKDKLTDEQIWHIVNFIRSIGPKSLQPAPAPEAAD